MILQDLALQNFRNYTKASFTFSDKTTIIVGENAAGKSNLIESIFLMSSGKSFRAEKDKQLLQFGKQVTRLSAKVVARGPVPTFPPVSARELRAVGSPSSRATPRVESATRLDEQEERVDLEIVFADQGTAFLKKKYLVNGVSRRRTDFAGNLTCVLFTPLDLDLVSGQPGNRRRFLDEVLEQVDSEYRLALTTYTKALRQRNALLEQAQETGVRQQKLFSYWDELLIKNGSMVTYKREEFIEEMNARKKDFFPCLLTYDKSVISPERLAQYKDAEMGAGVTLVGPHRDDVIIQSYHEASKELVAVRYFASRGQQRLVTLELKLAQIAYVKENTGREPLLLLDDIFSELDDHNIAKIKQILWEHQVIITTTHKQFLETIGLKEAKVIELIK